MHFYLNNKLYKINQPAQIETPRLVVFQNRVEDNISRMRELLTAVNPAVHFQHLCPHVKTHKSAYITNLMQNAGISFFKTSMNELDMLVRCNAPKIFVAYPLLQADARRVAAYMQEFPHIQFFVQVARLEHVEILAKMSREKKLNWHYYIDVNVGMNRTGLSIEHAFDFYQSIHHLPFFTFVGLHAYDGHIHFKSIDERRAASAKSMQRLKNGMNQFADHGVQLLNCIVAGTPSFLPDAEYWSRNDAPTDMIYSPGTWIYFDSLTNEMMPNTFDYAAVILAQVIDTPTTDTATLNLGHKRWAVDQGHIDTFSIPGMRVVSKSEEHTVVRVPDGYSLGIGDYLLIVPKHVCSTVNLWNHFCIVNQAGDIVDVKSPVDARNI